MPHITEHQDPLYAPGCLILSLHLSQSDQVALPPGGMQMVREYLQEAARFVRGYSDPTGMGDTMSRDTRPHDAEATAIDETDTIEAPVTRAALSAGDTP